MKIESYKKGIVYSTGFNMVAQVVGFAKNLVIAYYFGASTGADVLFYGTFLVLSLSNWLTCFDVPVILPQLMKIRFNKSERAAMQFANVFLYLFTIVGVVLTTLALLFTDKFFTLLSNFDIVTIETYKTTLIALVFLFIFQSVVKYLTNVLSAYKHFTMPQIVNLLNNVVIIGCIAVFVGKLGLNAIVFGTLAGYAVNTIFLVYSLCRSLKWTFSCSTSEIDRKFLINVLASVGSNLFSFVSQFTPRYLFSGFSQGTLASMEYGRRTADMPTQLISTQFSTVSGVKYNELSSLHDYDALGKAYEKTASFLLFLYFPIVVFIVSYRTEIISILYKRGKFEAGSVILSAMFLMIFSFKLPVFALNTLVSRIVQALQKNVAGSLYTIIFNCMSTAVLYVMIKAYGVNGFLVGTIIVQLLMLFSMGLLFKIVFKIDPYMRVIRDFMKVIIFNAPCLTVVLYLRYALQNTHSLVNMGVGFMFILAYSFVGNLLLNVNKEANDLFLATKRFVYSKLGIMGIDK